MIETIKHLIADRDKEPLGNKRSSGWPKVREEHLKKFPTCACCGGKEKLEVHHIKPFHLHPELELEPTNFITLCESKNINCHLMIGHLGNFKLYDDEVREVSEKLYSLLVIRRGTMTELLKENKDDTEGTSETT